MEEKPRIVIAGGSGFIGQALAPMLLARGYQVVVLTRATAAEKDGVHFVQWNGHTVGAWRKEIDGAAAVINLTGKSVNCRHTPKNRREIISSRVQSVYSLGKAIAGSALPPAVMIQASGIGFYGSGDRVRDENAAPGADFMADVCRQWEGAFDEQQFAATRKVILRIGIALGCGGGALHVLSRLTRSFLGGAAGNGRQFMGWIHLHDLAAMFLFALERNDVSGVFNATAPNPVTNAEFMRDLRRVLHRPWSPPAPAPLVRFGAFLMGTEGDLALQSFRCIPQRFLAAGFAFRYPTLPDALRDLYGMELRATD